MSAPVFRMNTVAAFAVLTVTVLGTTYAQAPAEPAERPFSITSTAHAAVAVHALESTERLSLDDESIFA